MYPSKTVISKCADKSEKIYNSVYNFEAIILPHGISGCFVCERFFSNTFSDLRCAYIYF